MEKPSSNEDEAQTFAAAEVETALEKARRERIKGAANWDELYTVLRELGPIKGSSRTYTPEEIIEKINLLRKHPEAKNYIFQYIPRSYGLRDKVKELAEGGKF